MTQKHHQCRQVQAFGGRLFIVLEDHGDGEVWPHGLAIAPKKIKSKEAALKAIDKAFEKAVARVGEEWNYDDVFEELKKAGFDLIDPAYWVEEEREVTAPASGGTEVETKGERVIPAEANSDDHNVEVDFDSVHWFAQASAEEIKALGDCGWGGDYPADGVAEWTAGQGHRGLGRLFDYLDTVSGSSKSCGLEVHVQEDEAMAWLKANRPEVYAVLTKDEE